MAASQTSLATTGNDGTTTGPRVCCPHLSVAKAGRREVCRASKPGDPDDASELISSRHPEQLLVSGQRGHPLPSAIASPSTEGPWQLFLMQRESPR